MSRSKAKRKQQQNNNSLKNVKVVTSGSPDRALTTVTTPATATLANYSDSSATPPMLQSGRQTQPTNANPMGLLGYGFLPRRQYQNIDLTQMANQGYRVNAQQLLSLLADISPEVSQALSNKVLLVNTGWYYKVMTLDGNRELKRAKSLLDVFLEQVNKSSGGIDAVIDSWSITCYLQGAIAGELPLNEDLTEPVDIIAVQPWSIHFERDVNQSLVPFQQQMLPVGGGIGPGNYTKLNPVTFGYIPFQAEPDDPYGRPPAAPVLQLINFDLNLLNDIRQAVHVNAWGRTDVSILGEALYKMVPEKYKANPVQREQWVSDRIEDIKKSYNNMKSDDAYIHLDSVQVKGVDTSGKMLQIDGIVRMLERKIIRALKEMPVLMGSNEGTTETHGTVQMDIYAKFIASIQKTIANLLEKLLSVALQVMGIAGKIIWTFEPVRATDRLADAAADMQESQVKAYQRDQGWITNDEASTDITGHEAVAEPKPVVAQPAPLQLNQGSNDKPKADNKQPDPKADPMDENGQTEEEKEAA